MSAEDALWTALTRFDLGHESLVRLARLLDRWSVHHPGPETDAIRSAVAAELARRPPSARADNLARRAAGCVLDDVSPIAPGGLTRARFDRAIEDAITAGYLPADCPVPDW